MIELGKQVYYEEENFSGISKIVADNKSFRNFYLLGWKSKPKSIGQNITYYTNYSISLPNIYEYKYFWLALKGRCNLLNK